MKLSHVALWTHDLEKMTRFWTTMFGAVAGAKYSSQRRPGFTSRFLSLADGTCLEIMQGPWISAQCPAECAGYAHIAIALGSEEAVRTMATKAAALGMLESPPRLTGDGYFEAVLTDPDGNLVEITA
ncbi:VOC family protein [Pseudomonas syringae]|nr:VOC family protein [Pseudomonas syringae]